MLSKSIQSVLFHSYGCLGDISLHHEIYLSDPRKSTPDKQKTVIRHPIKKNK